MKDLPAGHQLLLSLSTNPSDVPITALITQPNGTKLVEYSITKTPFTSTTSTIAPSNYTLELKNVGTRAVTVGGALLNSPISQAGDGIGANYNA